MTLPIIYNLFPLLAGRFVDWEPHLRRASSMGFNWAFVNPIQYPGFSGSLYSIKDYFGFNPQFLDEGSALSPHEQARKTAELAQEMGLSMMIDFVANHSAIDSPLTIEHPEWFIHDPDGRIAHPFCMDNGKKVVWGDLAMFDHNSSSAREELYQYLKSVIDHLVGLGFMGFRCDAAYQVPKKFWKRLIAESRKQHGNLVFAAETLGCTHSQTIETASAGFDLIFNSSKWWDMKAPWLLEQHAETRLVAPSVSFPESHDTLRLSEEFNLNPAILRQRYLFAAIFSAGVMMPVGFEFGFSKQLHVVHTRPTDWEETGIDIRDYISRVNALKIRIPLLSEESQNTVLQCESNPSVLLMLKGSNQALLALNKDIIKPQAFETSIVRKALGPDLREAWPIEGRLPEPQIKTEIILQPGEGMLWLAS